MNRCRDLIWFAPYCERVIRTVPSMVRQPSVDVFGENIGALNGECLNEWTVIRLKPRWPKRCNCKQFSSPRSCPSRWLSVRQTSRETHPTLLVITFVKHVATSVVQMLSLFEGGAQSRAFDRLAPSRTESHNIEPRGFYYFQFHSNHKLSWRVAFIQITGSSINRSYNQHH